MTKKYYKVVLELFLEDNTDRADIYNALFGMYEEHPVIINSKEIGIGRIKIDETSEEEIQCAV